MPVSTRSEVGGDDVQGRVSLLLLLPHALWPWPLAITKSDVLRSGRERGLGYLNRVVGGHWGVARRG